MIATIGHPAGPNLTYSYNQRQQLLTINDTGAPPSFLPAVTYSYDAGGNRTQRKLRHGAATDYAPAKGVSPDILTVWGAFGLDGVTSKPVYYQILTRFSGGRTIGAPSGISNAFWNSGVFESGPLVRYFEGECVSMTRRRLISSSRVFARQI